MATVRSPLRRTTVAQALAAMAEYPIRRAATEHVRLIAAEGRILAQAVFAPESVPAFARSMVDGYAVIALDVRHATRERPVRLILSGEVSMGKATALSLQSGHTVLVPTGGALPAGTTGVVKVEDTELRGAEVVVYDGARCQDRITAAASDVVAGERLFSAGIVLGPAALGLLAAAGTEAVTVYRPPAVGVLVTGDELVPLGQPLRPGQIRESNGITLCTALQAMGFAPCQYQLVADDREVFASALQRALSERDAVVISGGSSVGARDYTPEVVAAAGEPGVIVHGVKAKPGRPVLLAMVGDRAVIGVPGNPVSALVMLEALAKPILLRMFDKVDSTPPLRARLEQRIDVEPGLEYRIPVKLQQSTDGLLATPLFGSSSQMHILGFADAIIVVPEGARGLEAGAWVDAMPFSRSRTLR